MDYFDINLNLSEDDLALRKAAQAFARDVMRPVAKKLDLHERRRGRRGRVAALALPAPGLRTGVPQSASAGGLRWVRAQPAPNQPGFRGIGLGKFRFVGPSGRGLFSLLLRLHDQR